MTSILFLHIGIALGLGFYRVRTRGMRETIAAQNAQLAQSDKRDQARLQALNRSNDQLASANRRIRILERDGASLRNERDTARQVAENVRNGLRGIREDFGFSGKALLPATAESIGQRSLRVTTRLANPVGAR